jgi:hypothetical protein
MFPALTPPRQRPRNEGLLMRRISAVGLVTAMVPALAILPTVTPRAPRPHPVPPAVQTVSIDGIDPAAAASPEGRDLVARAASGNLVVAAPDKGAAGPRLALLTSPTTVSSFQLVGVTWRAGTTPAGLTIDIRVRGTAGWDSWERLAVRDEGPVLSTRSAPVSTPQEPSARTGTTPLLADPSTGYQVRIRSDRGRLPVDLRLSTIDPGTSPADTALLPARPPAAADATAAKPTIISRAAWGADESLRNGGPWLTSPLLAGVLHHTASSNDYTESAAASQVRAIYAYDTQGLGWSDIAYNFLVDKFGRIYEGRAGGIDTAVRAAHVYGFNENTFAVSALGNYDVAAAPAAMVEAISQVFAWKLGVHNLDPTGTATLTAGTGADRYAAGDTVRVPVISGHRDLGNTACPGRYLYPLLPQIRTRAASLSTTKPPALMSPLVESPSLLWHSTAPGFVLKSGIPQPQSWSLTVGSECTGEVIRTVTGSASTGFAAVWDLKDTAGSWAPPGLYKLSLATSTATITSEPFIARVEIGWRLGAPDSPCPSERYAGNNRYETNVRAAQAAFPTSSTVVLANGEDGHSPDALVGGPLAFAKNAPLLLATTRGIPAVVSTEIARRHPSVAYLLGGTSQLSSTVESQLRALGVTTVRRIAGSDRYDTAARIATTMAHTAVPAVIANGEDSDLFDALGVSGPAARTGRPILLVRRTSVPAVTTAALRALKITSTTIIGGAGVVPEAIRSRVYGTSRLGGADRYATAAAIADGFATSSVDPREVVLAGGDISPVDALSAGPLGRLLLFTRSGSVPDATAEWLQRPEVERAMLLGGPAVISRTVAGQVVAAIRSS